MKKYFNFNKQHFKFLFPSLFFAILLFALMFVVTFLINLNITQTVVEEELLRGKSVAAYIESFTREEMMKENKKQIEEIANKDNFTDLIHSVIDKDKNIEYVLLQNTEGETIIKVSKQKIEIDKKYKGKGFSYNRKTDIAFKGKSVVINENKVTVLKDFPKKVFDIPVPIKIGKEDIGVIRLGLSPERENRIISMTNNKVIEITTYVSMIGFVLIIIAFLYTSKAINKSINLEKRALQIEKLALVGELASGLAHEIRNPLNAMALNIQLLGEECVKKVEEQSTTKIKKIHKEIFHLEKILTDFLDFAKPVLLEKEATNVKEMILEMIDILKPKFDEKRINVSLEIEKNLPAVLLDRKKIKQVIFNLILNAIQATSPDGKIIIKITYSLRKIQIDVIDNGIGMSEDTKNKIFTLFYTTKEGGTGIGLPIVQKIVREHSGEIVVTSKLGEGSTFTIFLPISKSENTLS